jgi:hypothetical protein
MRGRFFFASRLRRGGRRVAFVMVVLLALICMTGAMSARSCAVGSILPLRSWVIVDLARADA